MNSSISLEEQIRIQRQYMWGCVGWACFLLILGIVLTVYFFLTDGILGNKVPDLMKLGPVFISTAVTGFPLKIGMECRARIATYRTLEKNFKRLDKKAQAEILSLVLTEALKQTVKIGG